MATHPVKARLAPVDPGEPLVRDSHDCPGHEQRMAELQAKYAEHLAGQCVERDEAVAAKKAGKGWKLGLSKNSRRRRKRRQESANRKWKKKVEVFDMVAPAGQKVDFDQ